MASEAPTTGAQPDVNLFDVKLQQCPYDAYKTLRDEAPAFRQPGTDIFIVTRYEDVRREGFCTHHRGIVAA